MSTSSIRANDVRLADLRAFLVVENAASVAAAAREMHASTSRISKIVARLERRLGHRLFRRDSRGIELTEEGRRMLPEIRALTSKFEALVRGDGAEAELTIAGEPYLAALCLPADAPPDGRLRIRWIEMPSAFARARLQGTTFDMALLDARADELAPRFQSHRVGRVAKGLFATPLVARSLGPEPVEPAILARIPFVGATYVDGNVVISVDDDCPLRPPRRRVGHQTHTMAVGLEMAVRSGQLIFGPVVVARRYTAAGLLTPVRVRGWDISRELTLVTNVDRVPVGSRDAVRQALAASLGS